MNDDKMRFYYQESSKAQRVHGLGVFEGNHKTDLAVLGAGFTGLLTAIEMAELGYKVTILEAEKLGYGASGRNGGHVCSGYTKEMDYVEKQLGMADAAALWKLVAQGPEKIAANVKKHQIDCDLSWGYIHAAARKHHLQGLAQMRAEWHRYGYDDHKMLTRDELLNRVQSEYYYGGVWEGGAGHLHPLKYLYGLARHALELGVEIYEDSAVTGIVTGSSPALITATGRLDAKFMVLAGNAYMQHRQPQLAPYLIPVGSYMMATKPLGQSLARTLIPHNEAVADSNIVLDYYRIDAETRLIFGGRTTYSGMEPADLNEFIHKRMRSVFHSLAIITRNMCGAAKLALRFIAPRILG
ncbi:MAG: NAD(P)/FAD-dependent oxidoreductase [Alphaproteobacteria bacterium]